MFLVGVGQGFAMETTAIAKSWSRKLLPQFSTDSNETCISYSRSSSCVDVRDMFVYAGQGVAIETNVEKSLLRELICINHVQ